MPAKRVESVYPLSGDEYGRLVTARDMDDAEFWAEVADMVRMPAEECQRRCAVAWDTREIQVLEP